MATDLERTSLLPPDPVVLKPKTELNDPSSGDCHDILFAIAFILQLLGVIIAAALTTPDFLHESQSKIPKPKEEIPPLQSLTPLAISVAISVALLTALLFSTFWLTVLKKYSQQIVQISLTTTCSAYAIIGVVSMAFGQVVVGLVLLFSAGVIVLFFLIARARINLAATTLQISTSIMQDNPGPFMVGFSASLVLCLWVLLWGITTMSVIHTAVKGHVNGLEEVPPGIPFVMLISFFWTIEVIENIVHVTTAGVVGCWWFQTNSSNPTMASLGRATTTSFGSICFGSLIVGVISTIRALVNFGRGKDGNRSVAQDCLSCIVGLIEHLVKLFNTYAFVTIAINGTSFLKASMHTKELFSKSGMDIIINDDLSSMVLVIGALSGLLLTVGFSAMALFLLNVSGEALLPAALICGLVGLLVIITIVSVLRSCVATLFVCWAQDPSALYRSHTNHYVQLRGAMERIHPNSMTL